MKYLNPDATIIVADIDLKGLLPETVDFFKRNPVYKDQVLKEHLYNATENETEDSFEELSEETQAEILTIEKEASEIGAAYIRFVYI